MILTVALTLAITLTVTLTLILTLALTSVVTKDLIVKAKAKDLMAEAKAKATAFCPRGSSRPRTCPRGHISGPNPILNTVSL